MNIKINNLNISIHNSEFNLKLNNYNLECNNGILCILGKSGSGKTTLLNSLTNFNESNYNKSGEFLYNNINLLDKNNIITSYVFQDLFLIPSITILENLNLINSNNIFMEIINILNLNYLLHKYPYQLSGGEKQRVCLVSSLIKNNLQLLILDEAFNQLDKVTKNTCLSYLIDYKNLKNFDIIYATNDDTDLLSLKPDNIIKL